MQHSYHSPANAIYEVIIGFSGFGLLFGAVLTLPLLYGLYASMKEDQERLA